MRSSVLAGTVLLACLNLCPTAMASPSLHHHAKAAKPTGDAVYAAIVQSYDYVNNGWQNMDVNDIMRYVSPTALLYYKNSQVSRYSLEQLFLSEYGGNGYADMQIVADAHLVSCQTSTGQYKIDRNELLTIAISGNSNVSLRHVWLMLQDVWTPVGRQWLITQETLQDVKTFGSITESVGRGLIFQKRRG